MASFNTVMGQMT